MFGLQSHVILSRMSGLIVCATQRSGSTLLCELLKATGVAGVPERVVPALQGHRARRPAAPVPGRAATTRSSNSLLPPLDPGTPEASFDFEAVRRAGTTPNGVFAAKIMWSHTDDLWARLRRPDARGRVRAAALRAGDPARQGRPGGVAVDGDPDAGVARRRRARASSRSTPFAAIRHLVELADARRARVDGVARAARSGRRRLRGLRSRPVADDRRRSPACRPRPPPLRAPVRNAAPPSGSTRYLGEATAEAA